MFPVSAFHLNMQIFFFFFTFYDNMHRLILAKSSLLHSIQYKNKKQILKQTKLTVSQGKPPVNVCNGHDLF